jgi:hypothetical protein
MESAFEHQVNNSYSDEEEKEDVLQSVAAEFSIKSDIAIKKKALANKLKISKPQPSKEA